MFFNDFTLDLTNILIGLASAVIIYFAWKSTNVREDRFAPTAVLIIENNRRRLLDSIVREPLNSARHLSNQSDDSNSTEELELEQTDLEDLQLSGTPPSLQAIIEEVNDLASARNTESNRQLLESIEEDINNVLHDNNPETSRIIEIMDNTNDGAVQRRRLTSYEEIQSTEETSRPTPLRRENLNVPSSETTVDSSHADNCSNENNENENISKTEIKSSSSSTQVNNNDSSDDTTRKVTSNNSNNNPQQETEQKQEFRIKLKYLNDELRLVKGSPNEAIGDFKKRNFTVELAAQKLVRLVFNGHVLQPDSKTLKACGLFDNCVVHCLVHNKKPSSEESARNGHNDGQSNRNGERRTGTFTDENGTGVSLVYFGIILSGLSIIFGWYCRFTYSFIFSWYSTIGLGIMTVIFLVLSPVLFLIERGVSL